MILNVATAPFWKVKKLHLSHFQDLHQICTDASDAQAAQRNPAPALSETGKEPGFIGGLVWQSVRVRAEGQALSIIRTLRE